MLNVHPSAIVHPTAEIADDVAIGPFSTIEPEVRIGPGSRIGAYVTIGERTVLGKSVEVFNYACIGTASQDKKHQGERSHVEIGDRSIIREFATVNRATREGGVTRVGSDVLMMVYSHVAHECTIGDGVVLVNGATVGGEATIEAGAIISGLVSIHQYCRVGRYSIVGANSKVTMDIPPFVVADGHPARPYGANTIGLRRNGFTDEQILEIRRVLRELFNRRRKFAENLEFIERSFRAVPEANAVLDFCRGTERGIAWPRPRPAIKDSDNLFVFEPQGAAAGADPTGT